MMQPTLRSTAQGIDHEIVNKQFATVANFHKRLPVWRDGRPLRPIRLGLRVSRGYPYC